jgi:hypothetical protein
MAQQNFHPGLPPNWYANLPVATVAQIAIPARQVINGTPASVFNGKTYARDGRQ